MADYHQTIAIMVLTLNNYMRRRIIELGGQVPPTIELYSVLSRVFTEHFQSLMNDRAEAALKQFAVRIREELDGYTIHDPEYDLISFVEYAEKYVKDQMKMMKTWCPSIANHHKYSSSW
jgi:hypothetical protein